MKKINFIDTTLRDGHQSLWATRMRTAHMLPIAHLLDRSGFQSVELMGTVHFDACLRYLHENPWERIDKLSQALPNTPLGALIRSKSLTSFNIVPDSVISLWIERCAANGIKRLMIFDALHDWDNLSISVATAKKLGIEVSVPLVFSLSPVHTDEFYAKKTKEMVEKLDPDTVMIKDSIGLLTPERTKTLVPMIKKYIGNRPLEMHAHCTTGLATLCCIDSVEYGVETVYTCMSPLANGPSHPSIENMNMNLKRLGYETDIDDSAVASISDHFRYVAEREGLPMGVPAEYDVFQYTHQVPGGMITNLKFMLSQRKMEDRLEEILNEISVIREEWGFPVMITPFSQIVGTQAVLNVLSGERYGTTTEEGARYVLGHYGKTPAPVDQDVLGKIAETSEGKNFSNWKQPQPTIQDLRKESGHRDASDDELLLRVLFPEEHVEKTLKAGPIETDYPRGDKPLMALIQELTANQKFNYFNVQKKGFSLTIKK